MYCLYVVIKGSSMANKLNIGCELCKPHAACHFLILDEVCITV